MLHAVRLVFSARNSDHVSPVLHELHWLRIPEQTQFFWVCVVLYRCFHGTAPQWRF